MRRVTNVQARRISLRSQGFARRRPEGPVTRRHLAATLSRLGFFQIDSVNVLQRAHLMPLYSRVGPYEESLFFRAAERHPRLMFEYWSHMAAYTDVNLWPAMQHRMATGEGMWGSIRAAGREHPDLVAAVREQITDRGALTARELRAAVQPDATGSADHWGWNWSATKAALEFLFHRGEVTAARRTASFERVYELPERVIPPIVLAQPALDERQAHLRLVEHAARALGVATEHSLRDYFRMSPEPTRTAIRSLVDAGVLEPVEVHGWTRSAFLHAEAPTARPVDARALLSPFDPLVFERRRTSEMFGFDYRIEIYVPEAQRVHGYYVLPFLLGEDLVARVDLKADRRTGRLLVLSAHAEAAAPSHTAAELFSELQAVARWLGLDDVEVRDAGHLGAQIRVHAGV